MIIEKTKNPIKKPENDKLPFGKYNTDHIFEAEWNVDKGWETSKIVPYHRYSLDPKASVFHYGLAIFEGMKAFLDKNDRIRMFRPDLNMKRFNKSASRLNLPNIDEVEALEGIKTLLRLEKDWFPRGLGLSMYIRPTMISTTELIHVGPASNCLFFTILSPSGLYFGTPFKPIKLYACTDYVRSWPGGTGDAKCGANYSIAMMPQANAIKNHQCDQVLWLIGDDHKVTESGAMNFFLFWKNENGEKELITAPLDGTFLEGVTRDSVIQLAKSYGDFKVSEKYFTMDQVATAIKQGRVYEAFGAGTAATIAPISLIKYLGEDLNIPFESDGYGKLSKRLKNSLFEIMHGEINSPWTIVID